MSATLLRLHQRLDLGKGHRLATKCGLVFNIRLEQQHLESIWFQYRRVASEESADGETVVSAPDAIAVYMGWIELGT